ESLLDLSIAELARRGGWEGAEVVMWLMMRGALSEQVEVTHKTYFLPSMTPIATMIFEEVSQDAPVEDPEATRRRAMWDYEGAEQLEGTYPFTIERSVKGFRINHFLHSLTDPKVRKAFKEDEEKCLAEGDLTEEERDLTRRRDWIGMIHYVVIFFMLEMLGAVTVLPNPAIYAAFKGMSLDDVPQICKATSTYGVASNVDDLVRVVRGRSGGLSPTGRAASPPAPA